MSISTDAREFFTFLKIWLAKDLKQFRWAIAGWIGLLLLQTIFIALTQSDDPEWRDLALRMLILHGVLWAGSLVVFVWSAVQKDPPTGTESFWLTRPIRPWWMPVEKISLLSMALLLPTVIQSAVHAALLHVPLHDWPQTITTSCIPLCLSTVPLIFIGLLARSIAGSAIWLACAFALLMMIQIAHIQTTWRDWADPRLTSWHHGTALAFIILGSAAAIIQPYFSKRRREALAWAAGTALAYILVIHFVPTPSMVSLLDRPSTPGLTLQLKNRSIGTTYQTNDITCYGAYGYVEGLGADESFIPLWGAIDYPQIPSGILQPTIPRPYDVSPDSSHKILQRTSRMKWLNTSEEPKILQIDLFNAKASAEHQIPSALKNVTSGLFAQRFSLKEIARFHPTKEQVLSYPGGRVRISPLSWDQDGLNIATEQISFSSKPYPLTYALINTRRQEGLLIGRFGSAKNHMVFANLRLSTRTMTQRLGDQAFPMKAKSPSPDAAWFEDAELVVYKIEPGDTFFVKTELESLKIR